MKPNAPEDFRGEFKPIKTNVPGLDICELMPRLARLADKYTIIRSVTTENKPGDHGRAPFYWLTGNPRLPSGTDEYPMYGMPACRSSGPAQPTCRPSPRWASLTFTAINAIAPRASSAPPTVRSSSIRSNRKTPSSKMLTPQIEVPSLLEPQRRCTARAALDGGLRRIDRLDPLHIEGLDQYQQTAFNMLRSPKAARGDGPVCRRTRSASSRYTRNVPPKTRYPAGNVKHFLLARAPGGSWRADCPLQLRLLGLAR